MMRSSRATIVFIALSQFAATYASFAQVEADGPRIAFYLVEIGDEDVRRYKKDKRLYSQWIASTVDQSYFLENHKIIGEPFLTDGDIESYCWQSHTINLTASGVGNWNQVGGAYVPTTGVPFVVVVDGESCYGAMVWNLVSSSFTRLPQFWSLAMDGSVQSGCCSYMTDEEPRSDVRNDVRVKDALRSLGKLVEICEKR